MEHREICCGLARCGSRQQHSEMIRIARVDAGAAGIMEHRETCCCSREVSPPQHSEMRRIARLTAVAANGGGGGGGGGGGAGAGDGHPRYTCGAGPVPGVGSAM